MFKKNVFSFDKKYYKALLYIALPITLQSVIQSSLSIIDQMMVGQLGEKAIAAVGFASRPTFILLYLLMGLGSGASVYCSQFWGKKDQNGIARIMGIGFLIGISIVTVFSLFSLVWPEFIISIFTTDSNVIKLGSSYLFVSASGFVPMLMVIIYSSVLRSTEHALIPMISGFISVIVNTFLNYILIFGNFGFSEMGVSGAALATTIARLVEFLILISIIYYKKFPGAYNLLQMFNISKDLLTKLCRITLPLMLSEMLWALGDSVFIVIYGRMGTKETAAMTISFPLQGLTIGIFSGLSVAAAVMLGKKIGENKNETVVLYAKRFIFLSAVLSFIVGLLVIVFSKLYISSFNVSEEVSIYSQKIIMLFGLIMWIKVLNMVVSGGILRSGGDTKFVLVLDTISTWCIGVPLGFLAAFVFDLPLFWVYLLISFEECVRLSVALKRTRSKKWVNNLVEEL